MDPPPSLLGPAGEEGYAPYNEDHDLSLVTGPQAMSYKGLLDSHAARRHVEQDLLQRDGPNYSLLSTGPSPTSANVLTLADVADALFARHFLDRDTRPLDHLAGQEDSGNEGRVQQHEAQRL